MCRKVCNMKKAKLLWIDLEMTGLEPEKDRILEVAAIATGWDLEPIAEYQAVVRQEPSLLEARMVGEFWDKNKASHDSLVAQNAGGKDEKTAEDELVEFMSKYFGDEIILAGNSIHQDRKFIDREMPRVAEKLHYRMLDVSAWKVYFEGALGKKFIKPENHRAFDDIKGSMDELKYYLGFLKNGR